MAYVHQDHGRNKNYMQNFDVAISGIPVVYVNIQQKFLSMRDKVSPFAYFSASDTYLMKADLESRNILLCMIKDCCN